MISFARAQTVFSGFGSRAQKREAVRHAEDGSLVGVLDALADTRRGARLQAFGQADEEVRP